MAGEGKAAASAESTAGRTAARACQAFERAWQTPHPPHAEQFLAGVAGPLRAALLFGLLKREITHRRLRGQTVTIAEYQTRFPDEGLLVSALFPSVEHLRPLFVKCGYDLEQRIASARTGDVYRVVHRKERRPYAVKVIPAFFVKPGAIESGDVVNLDYLLHPHIARPTELIDAGGSLLLINEYVQGMNFRQLVERFGRLPVGIACELACQVAQGLAQLHEHFKSHGAMTPTTLVVSAGGGESGVVKLGSVGLTDVADLRLSRFAYSHLQTEFDWRHFAAPEAASARGAVDPRSDVYSLGCTLQYLLSGRCPRSDEVEPRAEEIRVLWSGKTPGTTRHDTPRDLRAGLARMLAREPHKRPASASEAVALLARHADRHAYESFVKEVEKTVAGRDRMVGAEFGAESSAVFDRSSEAVQSVPAAGRDDGRSDTPERERAPSAVSPSPRRRLPRFALVATTLAAMAILAAAIVVWPRWFPTIPPWAATLAELPGPAGGWWFDEIPWYAPLVREEIATRAAARMDLSPRAHLRRLGEQFLTRADAGTPDTLTELERVTRDVLESRAGREADVVRQLLNLDKQQQLTLDDLRKEYRLLIPRLGDPTTATAYHLRALLHQFCSAPQAAAADFDQALALYREQDSPLFALCCCDRARLDFESLDDPGSAADRLRSTAIPATRSALLAIDAHCLTATVFGAWKGQFHEAAQALAAAHQIARKADLSATHPFHGLIVETEARIAADDWKLKKAKTLYGQACTIRQSLADGGYRRGWRKIYENRQGLATVEHFLGNQAQSQRLFGQLLVDLERSLGPSLVTMVPHREQAELRAMRPMLAECRGDAFLFGPDYDYERAGQAYRAALDFAADSAVDVAARWPALVSLRYKFAVTLALDRRAEEAARAVDDADAALESRVAPLARAEILLDPSRTIDISSPHDQVLRGYRALAKAYPLLKSGDDAERLLARRSLERLLDETDVGRHTLDMVLLAAQLLMESPACETDRLVRTIKVVRDLTEQFATPLEDEDVCGYFRRYALIAHSAAEYVRNTDDMTAGELSESIAYLERAHVVRGSAMSQAPAFAATPARLHTLAVGVSVYENHSQEDPLNLKSADDDARALHAAFGHLLREGPDGTKNRAGIYLPSPLSRVLVDQEATCRELWRFLDELRRLPSVDRQSDFVIVSLSGHGVLDEDGVLFFLPYDYATGNLLSSAVEIEELKNRLRMLGTHILLILDTCHSGAAARSPEGGLVRFKATSEDVRTALRKMAESEKSLAVLVAGRAREQAGESHAFGGHGALTAAVLEFLRQEPFPIATKDNSPAVDVTRHLSDGPLTLHDLRRYVTDRMEQFPFIKQTPDLFVSGPTGGDYRLNDVPLRFAAGAE